MRTCNQDEAISKIIEIGKRMGAKNYTPGYSGNISIRLEESVLITTSGSSNGYLTNDDFVLMDFDAKPINSDKKPSSEKFLHIEYYKKRPDINAVIHVHSPALTAFAAARLDLMQPIMPENVFYFGGIPLAKYGMPSSEALVKNTSKYFNKFDAILMENHGIIIGSHNIEDAYQKLEIAEEYAKSIIYAKILGGTKVLSKADADNILTLRN